MIKTREQFLKMLSDDDFKRGELPDTSEKYHNRMYEAYLWGLSDGAQAAVDDAAERFKELFRS